MRTTRPAHALLGAAIATAAACGPDEDLPEAAGSHAVQTVDGDAVPASYARAGGAPVFVVRGTPQRRSPTQFARAYERSLLATGARSEIVLLQRTYATRADSAPTLTVLQRAAPVITGTIARARATVVIDGARFAVRRP